MNRNRFLVGVGLLLALVANVLWAQSDQAQPSLADVAKRKPAAKAKRVVTNDEIPPSPEANAPAGPSSSAASNSPAADSSAPGAKPEAKKDGKAATPPEKQTRLQELAKDHDSLQKIIKQLQDEIAATNDQNRIITLSGVIDHAKQALAENEQEAAKLKAGGAAAGTDAGNQPAANAPSQPAAPPK